MRILYDCESVVMAEKIALKDTDVTKVLKNYISFDAEPVQYLFPKLEEVKTLEDFKKFLRDHPNFALSRQLYDLLIHELG